MIWVPPPDTRNINTVVSEISTLCATLRSADPRLAVWAAAQCARHVVGFVPEAELPTGAPSPLDAICLAELWVIADPTVGPRCREVSWALGVRFPEQWECPFPLSSAAAEDAVAAAGWAAYRAHQGWTCTDAPDGLRRAIDSAVVAMSHHANWAKKLEVSFQEVLEFLWDIRWESHKPRAEQVQVAPPELQVAWDLVEPVQLEETIALGHVLHSAHQANTLDIPWFNRGLATAHADLKRAIAERIYSPDMLCQIYDVLNAESM